MTASIDAASATIAGRNWTVTLTPSLSPSEIADSHVVVFANQAVHSPLVDRVPRPRRVAALVESPINGCFRDIERTATRFPLVCTHLRPPVEQGPPFADCPFGTNWMSVRSADDTQRLLDTPPPKTGDVSFMGSLDHDRSGAYGFRHEVAEYAAGTAAIDAFGRGIRELADKRDAIAPYRFSIAMENAAEDWYFTEKLVDCLLMETVPIYFGCPGIGDRFDRRGLIAFDSLDELRGIVPTLTPQRYDAMRPYVLENRRLAIAGRWHNHAGLLERIIERIAASPVGRESPLRPIGAMAASPAAAAIRRLSAAVLPTGRREPSIGQSPQAGTEVPR